MQVYKAFFKVIKKYKAGVIMYLAIILFMQVIYSSIGSTSTQNVEMNRYIIVVKDHDHSPVSEALYRYLDRIHDIKKEDLTDDQLKDLLYYQHLAVVIEIPEGFGSAFLEDGSIRLESLYDESLPRGIFVNMQIEEYLNSLRNNMALGLDLTEADRKTVAALDTTKYVSMMEKETKTNEKPYGLFIFLPFGILSILFSGILPPVLSFNETEKKNRMAVSATTMTRRNLSLVAGAATLGLAVVAILITVASVNSGTEYIFTAAWWLTVLNVLTYTLSITLLLSMIASLPMNRNNAHTGGATSFFTNIIGLSFAFLGGTFVDLDILGDKVGRIGQFTPNYWYSTANKRIWMDGGGLKDIASCLGLQLVFGFTCLAIGLAVSRYCENRSDS